MRRTTFPIVVAILTATLTGCFGEPEDEDGLDADTERAGWTITITQMDGNKTTRDVTSDPHKDDTDGDGIDDFQEMLSATDARDPDTDGDGLKDGYDLELGADTKRAQQWLDAGLAHERDGDEITFLGEWDASAEPTVMDTDEDGLSDGEERGGSTINVCGEDRLVRTDPRFPDTDDDHLFDGAERHVGTDPTSVDTDEDGVDDLTDVEPCGDLWVRFQTLMFTLLTADESGPFSVEIQFGGDPVPWQTDSFDAEEGEPVDLGDEVPSSLDVEDGQGNLRDQDFNITLTVFAYAGEGEDRRILDLTGDGETLVLQLDVRSQALSREGQAPGEDAGIVQTAGEDARLRLGLAPQIGR